jgi:hypothetical protein
MKVSVFASILVFFLFSHMLHAQWLPVVSPEGGPVSDLAVKGGYLFAGTDSSIFRSPIDDLQWKWTKF